MLLKLYNNLFESVCICRRRRVPVLHLKVSTIREAPIASTRELMHTNKSHDMYIDIVDLDNVNDSDCIYIYINIYVCVRVRYHMRGEVISVLSLES